MNKNILPKVLVILFFIVFLGTLSFFIYQRYQSDSVSYTSDVESIEDPPVQKNIQGLKNSNRIVSLLTFNGIDKEAKELSVVGEEINQNTVQKYPVDDGAVLICLESERYLGNQINFSQLNVWDTGVYNRILSYEQDFFEKIAGKRVNLILLNNEDTVVGLVVGGCNGE